MQFVIPANVLILSRSLSSSGLKPTTGVMEMNPPDLWIHHGTITSPNDKIEDCDSVQGRASSRGNRSDRSSQLTDFDSLNRKILAIASSGLQGHHMWC